MSDPVAAAGSGRRSVRAWLGGGLLAVYLVALGLIAFWPTAVDKPADRELFHLIDRLQAHGLTFITYDTIESASNVLLFLPFGAILAILLGRLRRWIAVPVGFLVSCGIEYVQGAYLPGRDSDPRDVVANTFGAILGTGLVAILDRAMLARRARRARAEVAGTSRTSAPPRTETPG